MFCKLLLLLLLLLLAYENGGWVGLDHVLQVQVAPQQVLTVTTRGKYCFILPLFSLAIFQGGCASVIVSLTTQCPQDLTPYSGKVCL